MKDIMYIINIEKKKHGKKAFVSDSPTLSAWSKDQRLDVRDFVH